MGEIARGDPDEGTVLHVERGPGGGWHVTANHEDAMCEVESCPFSFPGSMDQIRSLRPFSRSFSSSSSIIDSSPLTASGAVVGTADASLG